MTTDTEKVERATKMAPVIRPQEPMVVALVDGAGWAARCLHCTWSAVEFISEKQRIDQTTLSARTAKEVQRQARDHQRLHFVAYVLKTLTDSTGAFLPIGTPDQFLKALADADLRVVAAENTTAEEDPDGLT
jgi:hypothetical protein